MWVSTFWCVIPTNIQRLYYTWRPRRLTGNISRSFCAQLWSLTPAHRMLPVKDYDTAIASVTLPLLVTELHQFLPQWQSIFSPLCVYVCTLAPYWPISHVGRTTVGLSATSTDLSCDPELTQRINCTALCHGVETSHFCFCLKWEATVLLHKELI